MMKTLPVLLVLVLLGMANCACKHETATGFRSVEGCAINRMYRPLCGTDECNYINDDALICAQKDDRRRDLAEEQVVKMDYRGKCKENGEE